MSGGRRSLHQPTTVGVGLVQPRPIATPRASKPAYKTALVPSWLLAYTQDCQLQTLRFYVTAALLYLFLLLAMFSFAVVLNWDASALDLEPDAAANLVIGSAALLGLVITMTGVSRDVRIEYALFAAALWFLYNTVTSESCLCCVGAASSSEHDHGLGGASSLLDSLNHHLIDKQDACSNQTLVYALHQSFFILLIIVNYVYVFVVDLDYFRLVDEAVTIDARRRERQVARAQISVIADYNDESEIVEEVNEDTTTRPSILSIVFLILLLGLAAVPLACNSVQRLSFVMLLGKVTIVASLVALRLTNTYLVRYVHLKTAATHLDMYHHHADSDQLDTRFRERHQIVTDQQQKVLNVTIRQVLFSSWTVRCLLDVALGATAFVLCDWYMFACLAQLLAELGILWATNSRWSEHALVLCNILGVNIREPVAD